MLNAVRFAAGFIWPFVWPFITLKRHSDILAEYEAILDAQDEIIGDQLATVASQAETIDELELQIADYDAIRDSLPEDDQYDIDQAIAAMENDGVIDPNQWRHPKHG